jgi:beta-exotoxin I transport system permease protein
MSARAGALGRIRRDALRGPPAELAAVGLIALHETWRRRRAPLSWGVPLGLMSALVVPLYPSIEDSLRELVRHYPAGLKEAFGISELGTLPAYLHAEMFSVIVPVAVAFLAIRAATDALAGAEQRGELDVLLAVPVSRRAVALGALLGASVLQLAVLLVIGALAWAPSLLQHPSLPVGAVMAAVGGTWSLGAFFTALSLLCGAALHRPGSALAVAAGTLGVMYLVDVLGGIADPTEPLQLVSAFHYYGAPLNDGLDWGGAAILIASATALAGAALPVFARKDLAPG